MIQVRAGERIPLDGEVISGTAMLDTSALTGESVPRSVSPGSSVLSGSVNQNGLLEIRVSCPASQSTVTRILELVENASSRKARVESFITRFAQVYTPAVVAAAVLLALLPPLILQQPFSKWIHQALTFLVISCPCALVISVPLSFFGGIGGASRKGILFKGSNALETVASASVVVFDKTGTLTEGVFEVTGLYPQGELEKDELLRLCAMAESVSEHPIALSVRRAFGQETAAPDSFEERAGQGILAQVEGKTLACGNEKLMAALGLSPMTPPQPSTVVHLAVDSVYQGCLVISDRVRPDAKEAITRLRRLGVRQMVMLTGDIAAAAQPVAQQLGLDRYWAGLLPSDKVEQVEKLLAEKRQGEKLLFVGDGINDAPVLALADAGVAMGGLGSDAAIEAADVVLMDDQPGKLADAVKIARKTMVIARENIIFALGVKGLILLLGLFGMASMWAAVFADVGVAVIAILNAMRAMRS